MHRKDTKIQGNTNKYAKEFRKGKINGVIGSKKERFFWRKEDIVVNYYRKGSSCRSIFMFYFKFKLANQNLKKNEYPIKTIVY